MDAFGQIFLDIASRIALACLLASFALTVYRLVRGPSFADRIVALDMLMLIGIGFIGVMAVITEEYNYIDVGIALALVGFLATVAFARYIYRRALTHPGEGSGSGLADDAEDQDTGLPRHGERL